MEEAESAKFEQLKSPGPLSQEELSDQDHLELWLVRLSPQVDAEELVGCKLPVSSGKSSRSGGLELNAEAFVPAGLHLLAPNRKGKKLKPVPVPLRGQITVHQRLDVPPGDPLPPPASAVPPLPAVRPDRHPMLGVGYEEVLRESRRVLEAAQSLDVLDGKKSKKKRKSRAPEEDAVVIDVGSSRKKKRKSKGS
ncbi:uncharacterized protein LOC119104464 [Pollicipes pollicipes]|uniref:uncharacterized protein LOC119104464 n=1 Tax=Pollicipes pollicipes TaxID=41117 RepID=UPI0018854E71|nr:uncharacterized protein LOC119104464 [Pollicipes pollicipes]